MKELELTNGTVVRVRSVPPYATMQVRSVEKPPPFPREKIKSAAGGTEEHDVLEGSPLVEQWQADMQAYQMRQRDRTIDFGLDYGVLEWRLEDDDEFVSEPPDDWTFPKILREYGVEPSERRRLDYIKFELIPSMDDQEHIDRVLTGDYTPITAEEVEDAIASSFPIDAGQETA